MRAHSAQKCRQRKGTKTIRSTGPARYHPKTHICDNIQTYHVHTQGRGCNRMVDWCVWVKKGTQNGRDGSTIVEKGGLLNFSDASVESE